MIPQQISLFRPHVTLQSAEKIHGFNRVGFPFPPSSSSSSSSFPVSSGSHGSNGEPFHLGRGNKSQCGGCSAGLIDRCAKAKQQCVYLQGLKAIN